MRKLYGQLSAAGDVSTRMIIATTAVIFIFLAVVLLACIFYPKIRARLRERQPEKLKILFEEDFESGELSPEWKPWNIHQISIDGKTKRSGKYSCRMTGSLRGRNSSGLRRFCESALPLVIEFDCYNGDEPFNRGAHEGKGMVLLFHRGGSGHVWLFSFNDGGLLGFGWKPVENTSWKPGKWYRVKLELEAAGGKFFMTAHLDGRSCGKKEVAGAPGWMVDWQDIEFSLSCGSGSAYFDNFRIYQVVKDD
ncbi:MAG: hypothetical protein ACYS8W_15005 [Planctomycetota bacterium]|jgi:hypothetical protein